MDSCVACREDKDSSTSEGRDPLIILYTEGNRDNRILIKRMLQAEGYWVLEAADGPTGMQMAQEMEPELILVAFQVAGSSRW